MLNPLATQRASLELEGAHAKVHLHVNDPAIYMSLGVEDQTEPVLSHPMTVKTNGAKAVTGKARRTFGAVGICDCARGRAPGGAHGGRHQVSPGGTVSQDEDTIPTKVEVMQGKHWLRIVPQKNLTIGEYALVEIISPSDISESVWDFRVDPQMGDNPGSIGPILKQARDQ